MEEFVLDLPSPVILILDRKKKNSTLINNIMKRIEFISSIGKGVILVCSGSCVLAGCSSGDEPGTDNGGSNRNTANKVTISLSSLGEVGDQITKSGILFFRIGPGNTTNDFVATEAPCPHQ